MSLLRAWFYALFGVAGVLTVLIIASAIVVVRIVLAIPVEIDSLLEKAFKSNFDAGDSFKEYIDNKLGIKP